MHCERIWDSLGMHWGRIGDALRTHWDALGTQWGQIGDALRTLWERIVIRKELKGPNEPIESKEPKELLKVLRALID